MAEMRLALAVCLFHLRPHRVAIVAMKGIAVDDRRLDAFAAKDLLKGHRLGGRRSTRQHSDGNDRMPGRHISPPLARRSYYASGGLPDTRQFRFGSGDDLLTKQPTRGRAR